MPFILLLSIIEIEIAFIHISLTQLTRKHTPQFCLRILTRLKVLLTQPFDMSNPFRKQSTGVLNAALCCSCCSFQKGLQVSSGRGRGAVTETLREASTALGSCLLLNGTFSVKILEGPKDLKIFLAKNLEHPYTWQKIWDFISTVNTGKHLQTLCKHTLKDWSKSVPTTFCSWQVHASMTAEKGLFWQKVGIMNSFVAVQKEHGKLQEIQYYFFQKRKV